MSAELPINVFLDLWASLEESKQILGKFGSPARLVLAIGLLAADMPITKCKLSN